MSEFDAVSGFRAAPVWGPVPDAPPGWSWSSLMHKALGLAREAASVGEVPVGALLVVQNKVVVTSANATEANADSLAHAEILVLQKAQRLLKRRWLEDATLFVTMEPCPMCAGAIVLCRVGRVVYGCPDSHWGACGSAFNIPESRQSNFRPELIGGSLEEECRQVLQDFFRSPRQPD